MILQPYHVVIVGLITLPLVLCIRSGRNRPLGTMPSATPPLASSSLAPDASIWRYAHPDGRVAMIIDKTSWSAGVWGLLWAPLWALSRGFWWQALITWAISWLWLPASLINTPLIALALLASPFINAVYCATNANHWEAARLMNKGFVEAGSTLVAKPSMGMLR